jgi:hypothetical protein
MGRHPAARRPKRVMWMRVRRWAGLVSAFIIGVSAVAGALVALGNSFPRLFPFLAPFDASITLRDVHSVHATKVEPTGPAGPAVDITIEYILDKSGPSTIRNCRLGLLLTQETFQTITDRSQTITDVRQENQSASFQVDANKFGSNASILMTCEKRVSNVLPVQLPDVAGINKSIASTFLLCIGEYQAACGGAPNYAPCEDTVSSWAKRSHPKECAGAVNYRKISDVSGNKCGYAKFEVTCSSQ